MNAPEQRPDRDEARQDDPIARAAADWLLRQDRGCTASEQADFARWLAADPRHGRVFAEVQQMWSIFDRLPELSPAKALAAEPAVAPRARFARGLRLVGSLVALGAAAVLALGLFAWWWSALPGRFETVAATDAQGWQRVELPDGSVVQLNADSAVEVAFGAQERRVRLVRGQACFAVAKDAARPFVVRAGRVDVRAIGTAFDVRLGAAQVAVLVTEGRVQVQETVPAARIAPAAGATAPPPSTPPGAEPSAPPAAPALVVAGQQATIALRAPAAAPVCTVAPLTAEEAARALAWQDRRLSFDAVPLAELVATFNRYNRHQLVITDPRLAERRFGGTFPAGDYATLVRLLEQNFGVVAEHTFAETRLRLP